MELSLDLSLAFVPGRTVRQILGQVAQNEDGSQRMATLEDFLQKLEDEKRKIESFKRELPLCMLLVNDAITKLKEEINGGVRMQEEPVVLKTNSEGSETLNMGKERSNMKNWMNSVRLWNVESKPRTEEDDRCVPDNPNQPQNETNKSRGAALNGNNCVLKTVMSEEKGVSQVPSVGLMRPVFELNDRKAESSNEHGSSLIATRSLEIKGQAQPQQNPRKQRRCWSPELHRRFVDALQQLGGPQVATPKQIREVMQVVGLTNDEVKSHLQKYRLHFRRPQVCSVEVANGGLCLMVKDNNKSKGNLLSQSGSPQGPLFLGGSGRNSMDTEEDEQSDCHNWKGALHHQPEAELL
ncbi:transcription factor HHO5 isoform X1 [Vigna radiata var. radiata]|uniref:Transcription factor HHO5 isoform X1 n=1 Tax=Vigna radiata var. radiata TaxID=3916 RepID=A0A1S3UMM4_VIGRR|nr:transcription factor HHO5 isoform X1 [Vigna radiata var. radiata]